MFLYISTTLKYVILKVHQLWELPTYMEIAMRRGLVRDSRNRRNDYSSQKPLLKWPHDCCSKIDLKTLEPIL